MTEISSETKREYPPARKWSGLGTKKAKVLLSAALGGTESNRLWSPPRLRTSVPSHTTGQVVQVVRCSWNARMCPSKLSLHRQSFKTKWRSKIEEVYEEIAHFHTLWDKDSFTSGLGLLPCFPLTPWPPFSKAERPLYLIECYIHLWSSFTVHWISDYVLDWPQILTLGSEIVINPSLSVFSIWGFKTFFL